MTQELGRTTAADTEWFYARPLRPVYPLGDLRPPARHEWVKQRERIRDEDYQRYFDHFYPDLYDPEKWAREAKNAGMRYFVVTTKHHDGFCLWDSDLTDYKVTNTPWGEDLIAPMVEAFRAEGMKVGFYHSLIDWHHPEFPVDGLHSGATTKSTSRPTGPRHRPLPRVPARPDPRAPDPLRPGRCHVVRLLLLGPGLGRQGQGGLGL